MTAPSRVLLLTRNGCHLCDEAELAIAGICEELGATWHTVDVDSEEALRRHWTDHVPVTFIDETLHGRWFVDPEKLKQALVSGDARPMPADWRPPAPDPA